MKSIKIPKTTEKTSTVIDPTKVIKRTVSYYNFVIFVIVTAIGLIAAVIMLANIIVNPRVIDETNNTPTFDQNAITRVNQLETSESNTSYQVTQGGRVSPFSE